MKVFQNHYFSGTSWIQFLRSSAAFVLIFSLVAIKAPAQIIWAGFKAGVQLNIAKIDDSHFRDSVRINPTLGFNIGGVISFKVKDRYFLQTEYVYSLKTKAIKGRLDPDLDDKITYHYAELPILFTRQFKVQLGGGKNFKCYLGAGPNIAYFIAGRGKINSSELIGERLPPISYKIEFGSRPDRDHNDKIYYSNINRFQFGINLGAGMILEPVPKRKIILDLRYTFDQTLFGKSSADYLLPDDYSDNLRFRNRTLRVSFMYLMEYNISKKSRNKGKSNKKI